MQTAFDRDSNSPNYPPSNADQKRVKDFISNLECDLESLGADDLLPASLDVNIGTPAANLQSTLVCITKRLTSLSTAIAPHQCLPDDVILTIFTFCIPNPLKVPIPCTWQRNNWLSPLRPAWETVQPWNLLSVCSRWRDLILGTPTLWCSLAFKFGHTGHYAQHANFKFFELLLARSGASTPLKLEIRAEDCESQWTGDAVDHLLLNLIVMHAPRLKELTLTLPASMLDAFLASPPTGNFDSLETVTLEYPTRRVMDTVITRRIFNKAPRLRRFTIHAKLPSHSLELPWHQLSELHLIHTTGRAEDCHRILQCCPNLISCTLTFQQDASLSPDPHSSPSSTTLPNLTPFTLDCNLIGTFLTRLYLPVLEALTLQVDVDRVTCEAALLPFLHRSSRLTHLNLAWWVPSDTIRILLRAVPHLTHLHFVPGRTAEVFKLLWAVDLVPQLECLTFMCFPMLWEETVEIIGLRGLVGPLREVRIVATSQKDADVWQEDPRLRSLSEIGMTLKITNCM
ncbi:hypothetical protein FPV67DRAFT_1672706 [Lyophyllum atratum]|nr:hypothetical protein FPV67DRAFT_1672706 [Lyophyllum atratum]